MTPPRTPRGRAYVREFHGTYTTKRHVHVILVIGVRPDIRAELVDPFEHRMMEISYRRALHRQRAATVLADKLDAALADQRAINNRNRRNKRHG